MRAVLPRHSSCALPRFLPVARPGLRGALVRRRFIPDKLMKDYAMPRTVSLVALCGMTTVMAFINSAADLQVRGFPGCMSLAVTGFKKGLGCSRASWPHSPSTTVLLEVAHGDPVGFRVSRAPSTAESAAVLSSGHF